MLKSENSLVVHWLGLGALTAMPGSVPDWGPEIPQAKQHSQKKKIHYLKKNPKAAMYMVLNIYKGK